MRMKHVWIGAALLGGCGKPPAGEPAKAPPTVQFQRASTAEIAHGERLARVLGCSGCHGADLAGEDWSEPGFGRLWTANLTRAVPRYTDEQLVGVIQSGQRPDGSELWEMPSHLFTKLADDDMAALIAFLRSRPATGEAHPAPAFEEGARREIAAGKFKSSRVQVREQGNLWPPEAGAGFELGRYIVRATCAECHGMSLEGGQPHPEAVLRPDLRVVAPAYDRAAFARLLRTGKAIGNREVSLMSQVARGRYRYLTDAEVEAVHDYLLAVSDTGGTAKN